MAAAVVEDTGPDYLDVDVIDEDSGALPVGESARRVDCERRGIDELPLEFDESATEEPFAEEPSTSRRAGTELDDEPDGSDDEYEYVADSSGLEAPSDTDLQLADSLSAARRRRYESKHRGGGQRAQVQVPQADADGDGGAGGGLGRRGVPTVAPRCGGCAAAVGVVTVLYLGYLRRQTRIEERLRRRRAQRIARSRLGVENTDDREFDVVPARLRRPGSVVLEIDDEDPIFEHLDYAPFARQFDLPHAAGQ